MIKSGFVKTVLVFFLAVISASSLASEKVRDETALLTGIFPTSCHFSGLFVQQKKIEGMPVPLNSEGHFFYSCDLGLVWSTQTPFQDAILYVNATNNFRVNEDDTLTPLTGVTRYIMSNVFVKLLKGDADYFVEEFAVSLADDNESVELRPQSDYMKKGLAYIKVNKAMDNGQESALSIDVTDATGQVTHVSINRITKYDIKGKRQAFEQCETLYSDNPQWCQVLRSPSRFNTL